MSNQKNRNIAIAGTVVFGVIVLTVLVIVSLNMPNSVPKDVVDKDTTQNTTLTTISNMNGMDDGGGNNGGTEDETNGGSNDPSSNVITQKSWSDIYKSSTDNNTDRNKTDVIEGDPTKITGDNTPCKGCIGSDFTFGKSEAIKYFTPNITNGDDGTAVVKVLIDYSGKVVQVEIKQKGTIGNISAASWQLIKEAAYKTQFESDSKAKNNMRIGILTYELTPN